MNFLNETVIENNIDIETVMSAHHSSVKLLPIDLSDPTGGRHTQQQDQLVVKSFQLLDLLAERLQATLNFNDPYDPTVSELIKILTQMNLEALKKLYGEIDIGTSYRQETIRNILYEIIPRIGTRASVYLTRYLIVERQIKSSIAVQLLVTMPFHIFELSADLVKECEIFLTLSPDRPDVRQAAVLSFATLVYNVHVVGKLHADIFEDYVQRYFNMYLG